MGQSIEDAIGSSNIAGARQSLRIRRLLFKFLKVGVAGGVIGSGIYSVVNQQGYIVSDNAVVTAVVTTLRTPIEGYVATTSVTQGAPLAKGQLITSVDNPMLDQSRLYSLESDLHRIQIEYASAVAQRTSLQTILQDLNDRIKLANNAQAERLAAAMENERQLLAAATARRDALTRDLTRKSTLAQDGVVTYMDVDHVRAELRATDASIAAHTATLASRVVARNEASAGLYSEAGAADVAYSAQRADEVRITMTNVERSIAVLDGARVAAEQAVKDEKKRTQTYRKADIVAPDSSMVWRVGAALGERVAPGDVAVELVDCRASFMMVSVPQYRVPNIEVGGLARLKLAGEATERTAAVASITTDAAVTTNTKYATTPEREKVPGAIVMLDKLETANDPSSCIIGRTARVLLPAKQDGFGATLLRFLSIDQLLNRFG